MILAAGLAGIEEGYELPAEAAANLFELSPDERLAEGIGSLPAQPHEAVDAMERSELILEILGDHVFEWFVRNKRAEWADYSAEVTPFELAVTSRCSDVATTTPAPVKVARAGTAPLLSRPVPRVRLAQALRRRRLRPVW